MQILKAPRGSENERTALSKRARTQPKLHLEKNNTSKRSYRRAKTSLFEDAESWASTPAYRARSQRKLKMRSRRKLLIKEEGIKEEEEEEEEKERDDEEEVPWMDRKKGRTLLFGHQFFKEKKERGRWSFSPFFFVG